MISRLEKLYYRIEAQCLCLNWVFEQIASKPGVVFEIGLGLGRTFDHLRRYMPEREIYVFDRQLKSYPECTPRDDQIITGELSETLPLAASRFAGRVILAHSDIGSFSAAHNSSVPHIVSANLTQALADGAFILSDLPLNVPNTIQLPLPPGAREDRYYLYQFART
jgi:S-adenosyl-L-methionine methyltransferase